MANITFVYPDEESCGLQSLMAVAREHGHRAELVFYRTFSKRPTNLRKYISAAHHGNKESEEAVRYDEVAERVKNTNPDIVGFSCVYENYRHQILVAGALRRIMPEAITIFGGAHPTTVPERVLERPEVDAIAIGEAETSFMRFLDAASKKGGLVLPDTSVKGIVYKKYGRLVGELEEGDLVDLDTVPFPNKDEWWPYMPERTGGYQIVTSRGCLYKCTYCVHSCYAKLTIVSPFLDQ